MKRCFIALDLPPEVINEIERIQSEIRIRDLINGKFTELKNLHLTLKFLGEIEDSQIDLTLKRLEEIQLPEFEVSLEETGVFSKEFIRIIWIKLAGAEKLQKEIDSVLEGIFDKETRFMGHITIARVKNIKDKKEILDFLENLETKKLTFRIKNFSLKKSELSPSGPIYTDLKKYSLKS